MPLFYRRRGRGTSAPRAARGATLVEVLVAVGLASLLLALVLPAVQQARESARRLRCQSNARQLIHAFHGYHDAFQWPPINAHASYNIVGLEYSVHTRLLPFLGEQPIFDSLNLEQPQWPDPIPYSAANVTGTYRRVTTFLCPSDSADLVDMPGNNYRWNVGSGAREGPFVFPPEDGAVAFTTTVRLRDIADGLRYTAAVSEKLISLERGGPNLRRDIHALPHELIFDHEWMSFCETLWQGSTVYRDSGHFWLHASTRMTTYNHAGLPNAPLADCARGRTSILNNSRIHARSHHDGVVVMALMDGTVELISDNVDPAVWRALGTRAGGETVR